MAIEEVVVGAVGDASGRYAAMAVKRERLEAARAVAGWLGLWLLVTVAGLLARSAWLPDESRLLAAAWAMWQGGDWVVPQVNGYIETQAPLTLWLIQIGWHLGGVNDGWPRLVPALFAAFSIGLVPWLARILWPGAAMVQRYAAYVTLGSSGFLLLIMAATPLAVGSFFVLLAVTALAWMQRTRDFRVWLLLGAALGLGMLAIGPAMLLYVLPLALVSPLLVPITPRVVLRYWYADVGQALLMGLAIFALWAVPVTLRTDSTLVWTLIKTPSATLAPQLLPALEPAWALLAVAPLLGLPWFIWPLLWMRLWHIKGEPLSAGLVFCGVWGLLGIGVWSLLAPHQPQQLLPLVPAFTLPAAWLLVHKDFSKHGLDSLASSFMFPLLVLGALLSVAPSLPRGLPVPELVRGLSPMVGIVMMFVGMLLAWLPSSDSRRRSVNIAAATAVLAALVSLVGGWHFEPQYGSGQAVRLLTQAQAEQRPLAVVGAYQGQFQFPARLTAPISQLEPEEVAAWTAGHARGLLLTIGDAWLPKALSLPELQIESWDGMVRMWPASALR